MQDAIILLSFFFVGAISGFGSSAPLGPINLWLIHNILKGKTDSQQPFIAGVILVDCALGVSAIAGYFAAAQALGTSPWFAALGGCFLMLIGIIQLRTPIETSKNPAHPSPHRSNWKQFVLGASLCGTNPGFLLFWLFVIGVIHEHTELMFSWSRIPAIALGICTGDFLWFSLVIVLAKKARERMNKQLLDQVRRIIASAFLVIGAYTLVKTIL